MKIITSVFASAVTAYLIYLIVAVFSGTITAVPDTDTEYLLFGGLTFVLFSHSVGTGRVTA